MDAEKAALRLIARAEQCTFGLARKLERRGCSSESINIVVSKLSDQKLLDDSRYARLWLSSRLRLTRTPRRLLSSLCAKGIDMDIAKSALNEVLNKEAEAALLARFAKKHAKKALKKSGIKNFNSANNDTARELKFLLKGEGFSSDAIEYFLESLE